MKDTLTNRNALIHYSLVHAFFLVLYLGILSAERALFLAFNYKLNSTVLGAVSQDVVVVATLLGFWLIYGFFAPSKWLERVSFKTVLATYIVLYVIAIFDQQFYLKTGASLNLTLLRYAVLNFTELRKVLSSGLDAVVLSNIALALGFIVLVHWRCLKASAHSDFQRWALLRVFLPAMAFVPAIAFVLGFVSLRIGFTSGLPGVYHGMLSAPDRNDVVASYMQYEVPHRDLYDKPVIQNTTDQKPNIVLIVLESTRADSIPFSTKTSDRVASIPFLSRLAKDSLVIDNTYATVTHTSKALVGILCGMYPQLTMRIVEASEGKMDLQCLPHILSEQGYETAFFQTAPGSFENRPGLVNNLGFHYWKTQETIEQGTYGKAGYFGLDEFAMLEPAFTWINERREWPFFVTFLTILSHHPYELPYESSGTKDNITKYLQTLEHSDRFIAEIYAQLKNNNLLEDTLVIVMGDHGEGFGEHGVHQHDAVPYEEGTRVPFLISGTKWIGEPRRIGGLRHQLDLVPTVLDLLALEWQGKLPGESVLSSNGHEHTISSCWYDNHCLAMRKEDFKYIYWFGHRPIEKYDLSHDPHERNNLAREASVEELKGAIQEMLSLQISVNNHYDN